MDSMSVPELVHMRKYALLKLTAMMEKHVPSGGGQRWQAWKVHKLLRKIKQPHSNSVDMKLIKGRNINK
jgi:hypothetical protein